MAVQERAESAAAHGRGLVRAVEGSGTGAMPGYMPAGLAAPQHGPSQPSQDAGPKKRAHGCDLISEIKYEKGKIQIQGRKTSNISRPGVIGT